MARFRLDTIAELARQMAFTPADTRIAQLASTERLLLELDPAKAYPYDFVVFRITGYHPLKVGTDLLTGLALQHDLGLLIEIVSNSLSATAASWPEPVLSIDDVTTRFNVTSKTIQRWRRKGLPARRFIFSDGRRRVGFPLSSIERFVAAHTRQVAQASNFSQVDDAERSQILAHARRLATECNCCPGEISRRIGARFHRSPLTVLHTIKRHDEQNPARAIFPSAADPVAPDQRASIERWHRRGIPLRRIARKLRRTRNAIYRVVIEERVARLNRKNVKFIDDPIFHQDDAQSQIDAIIRQDVVGTSSLPDENRVPRDLPPYLQELWRTPLLSPSAERGLFLKLNFRKYQFLSARRRVDESAVRARDLSQLESLLKNVTETKNQIVRANLRLVVSVARKHVRNGVDLMELVSEGNLILLRAVDSFDINRHTRFATYATYALMRGFAREVPALLSSRIASGPGALADRLATLPDAHNNDRLAGLIARDELATLLSRLSDRERTILLAHHGLSSSAGGDSYEQIARHLNLSPHRVRQIERDALAKLRRSATSHPSQK